MNDVSHNSHNHIEQHNAIEQFDYANMTDYNADNGNRNCIGVEFQSDNFNDKNLINPLYESGVNNEEVNKSIDAITNYDYANIYDNKIVMDSENVCDTNANNCDNFKIDSNTDSKNSERKEEDSKAVKKSKKKSTKILKRIILSMEQQKAELEANRKEKKYIEAEFKCYNCALSFLFKDTYQAHMMRHEEVNFTVYLDSRSIYIYFNKIKKRGTLAVLKEVKTQKKYVYRCVGYGYISEFNRFFFTKLQTRLR